MRTLAALTFTALILFPAARAEAGLRLQVSPVQGQFAGTAALLEAVAEEGGDLVFQFAVRPAGGAWQILSDFHRRRTFEWATLVEGEYQVRVTARNRSTGAITEDTRSYRIRSLARQAPVLTATAHPLVALYSAPPCNAGWMRVKYKHAQAIYWQYTPFQPCTPGKALNFHVAGLRPTSTYVAQHQIFTSARSPIEGPVLQIQSGVVSGVFNPIAVTQPPAAGASVYDTTVLHSFLGDPATWFPVATDLTGTIVWYYPQVMTSVLRQVPGGTMLALVPDDVSGRIIREIDLAGHTVRETNSSIVSEQLAARGHDRIGVFHHEAVRLANGHTLVLASVERILVDVQGPGPVNVYGEMIVDLDENLQVAWAWNAFDRLDPSRAAILGQVCTHESPGCPALFLGPSANDWLHANSINYVAADGSLLVSLRHQDWVIKIDYRDGAGDGAVLWRLGEGGDFALSAPLDEPWPWFSHQHDARMLANYVLLFDNGNARVEGTRATGGNSRGQVFRLDETARSATLVLNCDLGAYSAALGSAQRLVNGNFYFGNGFLGEPGSPLSEGVEVAPDCSRRFTVRAEGYAYRSIRVRDLYRP